MVRIRLRRVGRKKQPSYRLVAAEKESFTTPALNLPPSS
jgi:ribosomal protein S16